MLTRVLALILAQCICMLMPRKKLWSSSFKLAWTYILRLGTQCWYRRVTNALQRLTNFWRYHFHKMQNKAGKQTYRFECDKINVLTLNANARSTKLEPYTVYKTYLQGCRWKVCIFLINCVRLSGLLSGNFSNSASAFHQFWLKKILEIFFGDVSVPPFRISRRPSGQGCLKSQEDSLANFQWSAAILSSECEKLKVRLTCELPSWLLTFTVFRVVCASHFLDRKLSIEVCNMYYPRKIESLSHQQRFKQKPQARGIQIRGKDLTAK